MTKYYFKSKSTGTIVEVSEQEYRDEVSKQEYRLVSDSYKGNFNFRQDSHMVVRDNCCDCEKNTLYVEEADMPF